MEGLWKEFDPAKLATPAAFARDPELVSRWYDHRRLGCLAAEPNAGHLALAAIERMINARGGQFTLLTQNVDRLHQRAGSMRVFELHGSIIEWRCTRSGTIVTPPPEPMQTFPPASPHAADALLRPNVVWFGEMLPCDAVAAAEDAAAHAEVFISVGTSAQVYPAAGFIRTASTNGAWTAEVNADETPLSRAVDLSLRGTAGILLTQIASALASLETA